jgi:hypothetical protein
MDVGPAMWFGSFRVRWGLGRVLACSSFSNTLFFFDEESVNFKEWRLGSAVI